ncbi:MULTISPECIES: protein-tyrosine-phosphatase [unclassified Arcicella]|uniref:protein-tyrosine-phosphatase n=1 Tax=unclassified Arcicella TaxID=2644986 RepID=UPI002858E591|nr:MULTISPECIES: protein-tyrosine-phosphatase [unclassified Arcicella]MDR6561090.1 protein-tyrosine phosphatase/arsenate reductase [Arcicella sp. BE51]MDR6810974.1 protein-tyrosine phosphatase/arsenate reductase [Arcicella sp. BE140]MDR6822324.1 protein-tyrosine phosphatase/arsenate reductase [Arcicella sp. BE139]
MYPPIKNLCDELVNSFDTIPEQRQTLLLKISKYIQAKKDANQPIQLVYVCTHNSRRSHFGQIWAAVSASYYGVQNVKTYSGGTEATAFNINAINALKRTGFLIESSDNTNNPVYTVRFSENESTTCFSKVYNDAVNPQEHFAAIMTCSDAEENCPFIPGVELRIGTTYDDPKAFDNTSLQETKYEERSHQIAQETLFVFSNIQ